MRIWKQTLIITDIQTIKVPAGAKMLDAQIQDGELCLWFLCDERLSKVERKIAIYGTGNPLPELFGEYISTFQMCNGSLVFHAFELN